MQGWQGKRKRQRVSATVLFCALATMAAARSASQPSFEGKWACRVPHPSLPYAGSSRYEGPQPFDMIGYKLDVELPLVTDDLSGKSTMIMRMKATVDSLLLHAVGLTFDTVRVDGVPRQVRFSAAAETFSILLGTPRPTGDTLRIEIWYRRTPGYPRLTSRQGYYFFRDTIGLPSNLGYTFSVPSNARFWMPCYDEPWEKATAEMNITVPAGYLAASNGRLVGTAINGNGTVTWRWREDHQIATYLMCMTASRFTVSTLPYVTAGGDTVPLQYFTWPQDSAAAAAYLPEVRQMVVQLARLFGEYPFEKYGMTSIIPLTVLGMEHQTITTLNRYVQTDPRVCLHELAHQWWGDLVTCGTWADIWLNESFATYSEALWRESTGGFPALKHYMCDTLNGFHFGSWQGAIYDPVGQGFNLFDQVVYSKGAWVLHTLRGVIGDSLFFRSLRAFRDRYAGRSAVSSELRSVIDSVTGNDMGWFFAQWIFGVGWPKYALRSSWSQDTLTLTVFQQQSAQWPTYRMPIRLRAYHGSASTDFVVWDSLRSQRFRLPLPVAPDSVVLDPDFWILKQVVSPPAWVQGEGEPFGFVLSQNYPNPFNSETEIGFELGSGGEVLLAVYDLLGRETATLLNEVLPAGKHRVRWAGRRGFDVQGSQDALASGVYVYRLRAGSLSLSRKLILLR